MADTELANMTELKTFTGDEPLYLVDDPAGTQADRKSRISNFFPPIRPFYTDATAYLSSSITASSGSALTANRLQHSIVFVPYERAFTKLACHVTALQGISGIRLGLYNLNQETLQPLTLIEAAAVIDASTGTGATGIKEQTITQTLAAGFYGLACVSDGTPSVVGANTSLPSVFLGSVMAAATHRVGNGLNRNFTYAALPADEIAQIYTLNTTAGITQPILGIR